MENKPQLSYNEEKGWIEGFYRGATSTVLTREVIGQLIEMIEKHQCNKVFFDIRQALSISTTTNLVGLVAELKELGLKPHYRWAVCYKNDELMHKTMQKMLRVRGIDNVLLSKDEQELIDWLNVSK